MSIISLPQLKGSGLLTHSRRQCFKTCHRKHYYRYELGIRTSRTATPLRIGSAVHVGLDVRARGQSIDAAVLAAVQGYEEIPAWAQTPEHVHEWMVERETVAELLRGYFWWWETGCIVPPWLTAAEIVESESAFEIPIRNPETGRTTPTFTNAGKRDKIVKLGDGRLAVMEHKTCGEDLSPASDYWRKLKIDEQISSYMLAARTQGHEVQTVLYDVIRKPSIAPKQIPILDENGLKIVLDADSVRVFGKNKQPRQSGDKEQGYTLQTQIEKPAEFGARLAADIRERPEFYFARQEIPRLDSDLEEFEHDLWQQSQAIRESQKSGRWFRNTAACLNMGKCEYFDTICTNGTIVDPANPPDGFVRVVDIHPELQEIES